MNRWLVQLAAAVLWGTGCFAAITIDPGQIPELRPPRETLPPEAVETKFDPLPWFIAAGVIAVVTALFLSRPKKQPAPPPSAFSVARKELETLNGTTATPETLSTIVRSYISGAFYVPALGFTPAELVEKMSGHPRWNNSLCAEVAAFLEACDEAKYSPASRSDHPASIENALAIISRIEGRRTSATEP